MALSNLFHTYNPSTGTLDTRANLGESFNQLTSDPATFLCAILKQADTKGTSCGVVKGLLDALPAPPPHRSAALQNGPDSAPTQVEHVDKTLAGLVEAR